MTRTLSDPRVQEIVALRRRRYLALSLLVSSVYLVVALACAFAPDLMRQPVLEGTAVSIGIASMVVVMLVGVGSSGYYTWWSNTVRDRLLARLTDTQAGSEVRLPPSPRGSFGEPGKPDAT